MQRYSNILLAGLLATAAACSSNGPSGVPFEDDVAGDTDDAAPTDDTQPTMDTAPDVTAPDVTAPDITTPDVSKPDVASDVTAPDVAPDVTPDVAPDVACPTGQSACGVACVNLQTDNGNCGACGTTCPGTQTCVAGACVPMCTGGLIRCSGTCVDTQSSAANCGTCGNACAAGQSCELGMCVATCTADQTRCGGTCVNTRSDGMNCGSCGNACPSTQMCADGACVTTCSAGQTRCGAGGGRPGSCADLSRDSTNCGSCGNACPAGQMCSAGACGCPSMQTLCGAACVNTQTDNTNCGMCGRSCPTGQTCAAGACACPAGLVVCGTACVDTQTSTTACGRCGLACGAGELCVAGVCTTPAPTNDNCATPSILDLTRGPALTVMGTTTRATESANTCRPNADVFYQFTLTAREIVYFDTFGTAWDTFLGLQRPGCSAAATNCTDDACGVTQTQIVATLDPGTYLLVVDQFGTGGGDFTLHVQHYPAGGTVAPLDLSNGSRRLTGTTTGTTGAVTSAGCCSGGAENTYFAATCPAFTEVAFRASTCTLASFDTELDFRSANRAAAGGSVCNDDSCGLQSTISGRVPAGAGLHVLYADACNGAGAYGIDLLIGDCPTGQTLCGAACVDLQTSATNCGACGMACAAGTTCVAGRCGLPTRYAVAPAPAGVTFTDACVLAGVQRFVAGADDAGALTPVPFAFRYWNRDFAAGTQANVASNGWLGFGYTTADGTISTTLPSTGAPNAMAAIWMTDLYAPAAGVCVATTGAAPNRRWITSWTNATNYSSRVDVLNFSFTLFETTNVIDIAYGTMTITSGRTPSTVGLENIDGTAAISHCPTGTTCGATSGTAFRYTPIP